MNLVRYRMLNSRRIWSPTGLNTPPPLIPATHCTLTQGRGEGESWTREKVRGAIVHRAGSEIPTWLTLYKLAISSLQTPINTCHKVSLQVNFLHDDILHCLLWVLSFYAHTPTVFVVLSLSQTQFLFLVILFHPPAWTWMRWRGRGGWGSTVRHSGRITSSSHSRSSLVWQLFHSQYICWRRLSWARICKRLRSPESDSKGSIPPAYVARLAGLPYRHARLRIDSWAP